MKNPLMKQAAKTMVVAVVAISWFASIGVVRAGVRYLPPAGSWDYIYEANPGEDAVGVGSDHFGALDGLWLWDEDKAAAWDGSAPGEVTPAEVDSKGDSPGGAGIRSDGSTSYLHMQDAGNPGVEQDDGQGGLTEDWSNPNNKRLLFAQDFDDSHSGSYARTVLDDGITISFRARIPTTAAAPLDDIYPADGSGIEPWPAGGIGYPISGEGRGMFGVVQYDPQDTAVLEKQVSFSLLKKSDLDLMYVARGGTNPFSSGGLTMNALNGPNYSQDVDTFDFMPDDGDPPLLPESAMNMVEISDSALNDWNEFWITIKSTTGAGSHEVDVYTNGSETAETFFVTAGGPHWQIKWQYSAYLQMGLSYRDGFGSGDVDFFSYKLGLHPPVAAAVDDADFDDDDDVDGADFLTWQRGFGLPGGHSQGDANGDGNVNAADLSVWEDQFGDGVPLQASAATVPEPTSLALLLLLGLFALGSDPDRRRANR